RIIERVKSLSTPYFLSGENFRNN
ncbi:MAG: hypothetical protein E6Y79_03315, partial [Staphylococcus aureus]|nr:hypothetical protein [Staphylococcus aureus]